MSIDQIKNLLLIFANQNKELNDENKQLNNEIRKLLNEKN
jgi:hypothetical protein